MIPFLLTQMSSGAAAEVVYPAASDIIVSARRRTITPREQPRTLVVSAQHRTVVVKR